MRYRRYLSTPPLSRVPASFERVPRVFGNGLSGRHPVPADLSTSQEAPTDEIPQVAGTEPELDRRLGERYQLFLVQRPPGP
jgi:hypothetical protein